MDLNTLPPKGEKRVQAITALGTDIKNAETLFTLSNTEKGNCKQAAMMALARFDYTPAIPLWKKLLKSKTKGEKILMESTADSVSDVIANEIYSFLSALFEKPDDYTLTSAELENLKTYISLMLGKASGKMQEVYTLTAQNSDKFSTFTINENTEALIINDYLRFFSISREDKKKIFPAILSMSILYNPDDRLIKLADELYATYQANWLSPVFMKALLVLPAKNVFDEFHKHLSNNESATYIYDTLGALYFNEKEQRHQALLFWGQYKYGEVDTRISRNKPLFGNLYEEWFSLLTSTPQQEKPSVTLQAYNRGGVLYDAFDEMLVEIIPYPVQNEQLRQQLCDYFIKREKKHNGQSELYIHAFYILGYEIEEEVILKFLECKENAASVYNLQNILQRTHWSKQKRLDFFDTVAPKKFGAREAVKSCRDNLAK
ncbi:hypothetical protein D0T84_09950 [Dysgonomonas sp. 521]|uniref:hypothetical protein n=1 Tax=Dysgonomonas sp. 521 TaxID=2302932 RepID=UPI0013D4571F|nr:hypothetical protein [Dysgonomonas sp. 521]NDV95242.1 hypothetical protein [Dysgonomonas sp. 521]